MRDYLKELEALESVFGFNPATVEQGTEDWHRMRLGVVTASKADCLLAKPGTVKRDGYMAELVGQIATGVLPEQITAKAMQWGHDNEEAAREAYEAESFEVVQSIPFIYKDDSRRFGCSPDGLILDHGKGLELKAPWATRTYIEFVCADKIKQEYIKQCQFSMWISGLDTWEFYNFDPRMKQHKLHGHTIYRDDKIMSDFDEKGAQFIYEMDEMIKKIM